MSQDRATDEKNDPLFHPDEPGAYVGRRPERQAETIPGGVRPEDERIAAHSTEVDDTSGVETTPSGHREGHAADEDIIREAGQDR
jgi:hypothetical protein